MSLLNLYLVIACLTFFGSLWFSSNVSKKNRVANDKGDSLLSFIFSVMLAFFWLFIFLFFFYTISLKVPKKSEMN